MTQLSLDSVKSGSCPYGDFIDDGDNHCNNYQMASTGYEPLAEDSPDHQFQMATVDGPYLDSVVAIQQTIPELPLYVPVIPKGSGQLFGHNEPSWVGVHLSRIISGDKLSTAKDVRKRLGVPASTKVMLLAYGKDRLIENIWERRRYVLKDFAQLGFDLVTSINYSIWDFHPHPEKIFNVKRSLVIYQEMQELGMPAVPHIYWYSRKSMALWADWLNSNHVVNVAAMNIQTLATADWLTFITELREFVARLKRPIHFIITGPVAPARIAQMKESLGTFTLTNSSAAQYALHRRAIDLGGDELKLSQPTQDVAALFDHNVGVFNQLMTI
jgi:hypothetical protein